MVVCIAHANHRTSWKLQVAVHNEHGLRKWSSHLLKVRWVTNGGTDPKAFGIFWTLTQRDVLEAWLYPATVDFLPAMSNLGSSRQFTLKGVNLYT